MEIGIIACIVLQTIIIVLMIYRKNNSNDIYKKEQLLSLKNIELELNNIKTKNEITQTLYTKHSTHIDDSMLYIQNDLRKILKEHSYSLKQLDHVYDTIQSVNNMMINKKTRGNFGEYQLNHLLNIYAGESNEIYETQYKLNNNTIADVALRLPEENKVLIIDAKFPLENYMHMLEDGISELQLSKYQSLFKQNVKKHIDDISKKYITKETLESAVMFIPSEAIYFYICSECAELIDEAHKKHILITSPTTLLGVVFTLVNITKDIKRTKNIKQLEKDIVNMFDDVVRLRERTLKLDRSIEALLNASKDMKISCEKIGNKIEKIHDGYCEE